MSTSSPKTKRWYEKVQPAPVETPIICPHCGEPSGYTHEGLMFYIQTDDLLCRHCGEVVIPYTPAIF